MERNKNIFSIYFDSGSEWKSYVGGMKRSRTWGDELTLRAIADSFGCCIHVVTSTAENWYLKYEPEKPCKPPKSIFISYIAPIHYNSFQLLDE
jgi:hypothetical protein